MIKVKLIYPWRFPDSPYYKYLLRYPPKGVFYKNKKELYDILPPSKKSKVWILKKFIYFSRYIIPLPNIKFCKDNDIDLIHCAHCECVLSKKPWVVDVENFETFGPVSVKTPQGRYLLEKILKKQNCKKILPWSFSAKNEIERYIKDSYIRSKIKVIYPGIPISKEPPRKSYRRINLLFIARYFYDKGGLYVLKLFDKITTRYDNVYAFFRSSVPPAIIKKYKKNNKIIFLGWLSSNELKKILRLSHIFVYPGFTDTFGFGIVEAMSYSIPIVTVDGFARKELVQDGVNGFVIPRPKKFSYYKIHQAILSQLTKKISYLIENTKVIRYMGGKSWKIAKNKFSIDKRNKKLREIYEEVLKK